MNQKDLASTAAEQISDLALKAGAGDGAALLGILASALSQTALRIGACPVCFARDIAELVSEVHGEDK